MSDDYYLVGSGKTYDTAAGFLNAVNALPTDMSTVSGHQIVELYPDYTYDWITATKTINPSNPSPSKKIIFRPAAGYAHKGVFGAGVKFLMNTAANTARFNLTYPYIEVWDLEWEIGVNNNREFRIFDIYGSNVRLQNLLVEVKAGTTYSFYWRPGSGGFQNNCIGYSTRPLSVSSFVAIDDGSHSSLEINDNLVYGDLFGGAYYLGNSSSVVASNNGYIASSESISAQPFTGVTNVTGRGNYHNITLAATFGSNFLKTTLAAVKFQDVANKKLTLRIDSVLINTGSMKSGNNPNSISGEAWNANHRSPYNSLVLTNSFMQPPEDVEYVRGNHNSHLIFNVLSPGREATVGKLLLITHDVEYSYSPAGYLTKGNINSGERLAYTTALGQNTGKYLTASVVAKSDPLGNNGPFISQGYTFGTATGSKLKFYHAPDFVAEGVVTSYINQNDLYHAILSVDLSQSSNAEKVKIYAYQKGFLSQIPLTFTGTPPSSFAINSAEIELCSHGMYQGVTTVWDRKLTYDELYTLGYDPFIIYRSDKKFFRLIDLIKSVKNFKRGALRGILRGVLKGVG